MIAAGLDYGRMKRPELPEPHADENPLESLSAAYRHWAAIAGRAGENVRSYRAHIPLIEELTAEALHLIQPYASAIDEVPGGQLEEALHEIASDSRLSGIFL